MFDNQDDDYSFESLEGWVDSKCQDWRDHFEANYSEKFDEYYRLWRGHYYFITVYFYVVSIAFVLFFLDCLLYSKVFLLYSNMYL